MNEKKKWILHRVSAILLAPLFAWFYFFENPLFKTLTIALFFIGFFHAKISLNEMFEDYVHNKKIKDVANILSLILSIIIPVIILILLI